MKLIDKNLFEFEREDNLQNEMGIGRLANVKQEMEDAYVTSKDIEFNEFGIIIKNKKNTYSNYSDAFRELQFAVLNKEKAKLARGLFNYKISNHQLIVDAFTDGLNEPLILAFIDEFAKNDKKEKTKEQLKISATKLGRSKEKIKEDDENNIYVFIRYFEKLPIEINNKSYYEDKFVVENMIKIDKFNHAELSSINMLKMRCQVQYGNNSNANAKVYMLHIPKELMDDDNYYDIPSHLQDIVEKYKQTI